MSVNRIVGLVALVVCSSCGSPVGPGGAGGGTTTGGGSSGGGGPALGGGSASGGGTSTGGGTATGGGSAAGGGTSTGDAGTGGGRDCSPMTLELDTPFSTTAPPYATRTGQQSPSSLWGTIAAPRPTSTAWENFVLGAGQNRVDFLPYQLKALPEGLAIALAAPVTSGTEVIVPDRKQLLLGSLTPFTSHALSSSDLFSATISWKSSAGSMTTPLVFGMPYVTADYASLTPAITPGTLSIASVDGSTAPAQVTGTRFLLTLSDGSQWLLYASNPFTSGPTVFDWNHGAMTAHSPFTGTLRVASLPTDAAATVLDAHAGAVPRGAHLDVSTSCELATLHFVYATTGTGPLLMAALPHHVARLLLPALTDLTYPSISGALRTVEGSTWTLALPLSSIDWTAPRALEPSSLAAVKAALATDASSVPDPGTVGTDPYFGGKLLARLARLALIADELKETTTAAALRARLSPLVAAWLEGTNANPFVYDTTWGGVVTTSALASPGAQFGQGHYNDHHFHYGYFLYAAAALAHADPAFATAHRAGLLALVRDIANPSPSDPYFPPLRTMDVFRSHSWAAGLTEFPDGQNQESTSEAVNAWYGLHLLGLAMNEPRMSELGRVLMALEVDGAQTYWQIPAGSSVYADPFAQNRCVGILFQTKATFATWFAAGAQYVYGIQLLPFTPGSEALLSKTWVSDAWPLMSAAANQADQPWRGLLVMAHAVSDRPAAWTQANALTAWDDGNSKTNTLWWVASRPAP